MSKPVLTKSHYAAGVQCSKRLYLLSTKPDLATPPSADLQLRFTQGQTVGQLARARFADGVLISESGDELPKALEITTSLIHKLQVGAIYEGAILFDELLIRVDILKNNYDGTWDLIEVKSTTELKNEHLEDLAFQLYVLKGAGIKIRKTFLSHINSDVRYPNLDEFFVDHDLTEAAEAMLSQVEQRINSLRNIVTQPEAPKQLIGKQCSNPYGCEFKSQCWAGVPKGSTLELYNYRKRKPTKFELYHQGPKMMEDLTNQVELTPFQQIQVMASKTDEPIIDHARLQALLDEVKYPIYYFDFETIAPAIPTLTGMRPYQRIPVQFSCHIQKSQGAALEHHEFLASGIPGIDPREECIDAMKKIFVNEGTIVAYHDDFERSLIRELAASFVESKDYLTQIETWFWDLEDVFHQAYYHKDFGGSVSIKKVLPYFSPDMSYDSLVIKNGGHAQAALVKLFSPELSSFERQELRKNLLIYCHQDSLAMVVIHQKLMSINIGNLRLLRTIA